MFSKQGRALALLVAGVAVVAALPAGLQSRPRADEPMAVNVEVGDGQIDFKRGKLLVARYVTKESAAKPYFWPINAPHGQPITRAWPMVETPKEAEARDHVHQKSAWFCHGDVVPEGMEIKHKIKNVEGIDFWSEAPGHGKIVCTKVDKATQEKNHGKVVTHNEWRTADGDKIMDETRTIHLYDLGASQLLVLEIDLHASVVPIIFADTKEGAMGVRVRQSVTTDKGKGTLTNAEGHSDEGKKNNADKSGCWGLLSAWCDYSGPVEDQTAGIALFADPDNSSPSCWHARGYGLLAANPFGRGKSGFPDMKGKTDLVKLAKGEHLKLRFGILLHPGDVKEGKVAEHYKTFVDLKKKN
jgi:hypothetical protein